MKVSEHFLTIQGEGRHAGIPVYLIRLFGCNLDCIWCDAKYATGRSTESSRNKCLELTPEELSRWIGNQRVSTFLWTGGEPMLQIDDILKSIELLGCSYNNHIETNGTILTRDLLTFDYISFSPKTVDVAEAVSTFVHAKRMDPNRYEIKVVTDLALVGTELISYATTLMPLTVANSYSDTQIRRSVWGYCSEKNIRFSPRLQLGVEAV